MPLHEGKKHLNGRIANKLWCVCTAGNYR